MAGHDTDSHVHLHALRTFLHTARMLFLITTFFWLLGAGMLCGGPAERPGYHRDFGRSRDGCSCRRKPRSHS